MFWLSIRFPELSGWRRRVQQWLLRDRRVDLSSRATLVRVRSRAPSQRREPTSRPEHEPS